MNVTTESWPRIVALGLGLALSTVAATNASAFNLNLKKLGEVVQSVVDNKEAFLEVTEEREIEIGRGVAARLLGAVPLADNAAIQSYVNRVGLWVALQSERPGLPWQFGVLDSESINAFAAPGGMVFITTGLLATLANEAELASVLAHEVSHVVRRHHLQAMQKTARTKLTAEVTSTMVSDSKALSDALIGVGMELYAKGLDRSDEFDADRRGVVLAARAGYDPFGLPAVLGALAARGSNDSALALMVSTHPSPEQRLEALDESLDARFETLADVHLVEPRFTGMLKRLR